MNGVYAEAIKRWGIPAQTDKLMEECAELILAAAKWKNGRNELIRDGLAQNCIEEIADVEIMIAQFKKMIQPNVHGLDVDEAVKIQKVKKLDKLRERLIREMP